MPFARRVLVAVFSLGLVASNAEASVPLVDAVKRGDHAALERLVERKANVNAPEGDGSTALHWAAQRGDERAAGVLLRAGAQPDAKTRYGMTPLALAARNGTLPIVGLLLDAGADANAPLPQGLTPLILAARSGSPAVVQRLLSKHADPNLPDGSSGQTPLMWAAAEGHTAVIKALVNGGADVNRRSQGGWTAILFAAREGRLDAARELLDSGADVNDAVLAVRPAGRGAAAGNAPTATTATPELRKAASVLVTAIASAHYELAAFLLDRGADPNAAGQGWTALHQLAFARKPGGGGGPGTAPPPTGSGSVSGLELARRLATAGADLNATMTARPPRLHAGSTGLNTIGATPFLMASRSADVPLMRLLVELGGDPRLPNQDGSTPLIVAAGLGTSSPGEDPGSEAEVIEAVKLTLELGNDLNAVDRNGNTAMHGAAFKQVPSVVAFLAAQGADIRIWNQRNNQGWTPLRIAAGVFRGAMIRLSLETADAFRTVMLAAGASVALDDADIHERKTSAP